MSFGRVARGGLVAVLVVAAIGSRAPAVAAPARDRADATQDEVLLRRGVELRRQGRDEEALEIFRSAFRLRATPRAQAQMGLAEQALGHWVDADADIAAAVRAREDPWIARNMNTLLAAHGKVLQHLGQLQVLGSPAGATIQIDDRNVGALPMKAPVHVPLGEVVISVSAPGHLSITRRTTIPSASEIVRETIVLHEEARAPALTVEGARALRDPAGARRPARQTAASSEPGTSSAGDAALVSSHAAPPAQAPDSSDGRSAHFTVAGVAAGASVLILAGGITLQVLSSSLSQQFNDVKDAPNPTMQCNQQLPNAGGGRCQQLLDTARTRKGLAYLGYGVAGVAAAISLVALITTPSARPGSGKEVTAACVPTLGDVAGFSCALTLRL